MQAHYLQHVPFEGLGSIEPWLRAAKYEISSTRFYESADLPLPNDVDLLIVMGGPMSVNEEAEHPWLAQEKRFIRSCIHAGKPVLGICLGSQLIASAMGARVYRHHRKEIGWFPIQSTRSDEDSGFHFPSSVDVFHWHGETFELPAGATLLAKSEACDNQAFQLGQSVIGLQFHLETTPDAAREIVSHCRAELSPADYVQSEATILAASREKYVTINNLMGQVLTFLTTRDG
jgi:GMP synthase-like glutamine amidotransferase